MLTMNLNPVRNSRQRWRNIAIGMAVMLATPAASLWVTYWERRIRASGVALDALQLADARAVGVAFPEHVRLLPVERVPFPRWAGALAKLAGAHAAQTAGLTARYGIFIRADHWGNRALLLHELAHTAQYERLNGIRPFLKQYLQECLTEGYPVAALELDAAAAADRVLA